MTRFIAIVALCLLGYASPVMAEEMPPQSSVTTVEVPAPDTLSDADKKQIEAAIRSAYGNVELEFVPDGGTPEAFVFGKGIFCKAACAAAYAAATVACAGISGPLAAVCMSAANAANELCLKQCK